MDAKNFAKATIFVTSLRATYGPEIFQLPEVIKDFLVGKGLSVSEVEAALAYDAALDDPSVTQTDGGGIS